MHSSLGTDAKLSRRVLQDRLFKLILVGVALGVVLLLTTIIGFVIQQGISVINWSFFTHLPQPPGASHSGILNAILGTLMLTVLASLISIPVGIWCGVAMAEHPLHPLVKWAQVSVDGIQSIPSILFGIMAYLWVVVPMGQFSAVSGAVALSMIMLPIVIRAVEEAVRRVPTTMREASLALGVSPFRTTIKVVIPCALNGILTGSLLGVSRISGETAPLLFTAFGSPFLVISIFQPVQSMPILIYNYATSPYADWQQIGWGASLVLILFCFVLSVGTRWVFKR